MEYSLLVRRAAVVVAALAVAASSTFLQSVPGGRAASPEPAANPDITMSAEPMLGGTFQPGTWAAVRVRVENDGPQVDGELRIATAQGASTYGIPVQLASGARQEHVLYGQVGPLGSRFVVALISGGSAIASATFPITGIAPGSLGVFVIAEHPEALVTSIRGAVTSADGPPPVVVPIGVGDLPPRVEAWASVDRMVWQDVDSTGLDADQLAALRTWVSVGGQLVILGGTTGTSTLGGFPGDLLPYQPTHAVDVPITDLQGILGTLPLEATPLPAVAGTLERGTILAQSGGEAIAARSSYGQGSVVLVGFDPSTPWLAGSSAADVFWARALPPNASPTDPRFVPSDDVMLNALNNLPSVQLPRMDQLFVLIVAYIIVIGPLNYVLLRRRDRREWAWLTMPAVILLFAVAAYGFGVVLKGTNTIVNELAIVRGSVGTDQGLAEVHIGVFSPNRATFDVKVGGRALLSAQVVNSFRVGEERPLDVLLGEPSTLRGYSVGFGVLRGFRAEAPASIPRFEADLRLVRDVLEGSITNTSGMALPHVSVVYGNGVEVLGAMAPGETRSIALTAPRPGSFPGRLSDRILGQPGASDAEAARTLIARRAMIQHLAGGFDEDIRGPVAESIANGPVILAFSPAGILDIDIGTAAEHVGETLFVLSARALAAGPVVFTGGLVSHTVVEVDAIDGFDDGFAFNMGRGTMTADYRPLGFEGVFDLTGLTIRLAVDEPEEPAADGPELAPLPAEEQPDSVDPMGSDPQPQAEKFNLPRIQLFDRVAGTWIEFEPPTVNSTYRITDPKRYVDSVGTLRVRFVLRDPDAYSTFSLTARLEGTVL